MHILNHSNPIGNRRYTETEREILGKNPRFSEYLDALGFGRYTSYGCPPSMAVINEFRQKTADFLDRKLEDIIPFTDLTHVLGSPESIEELQSAWSTEGLNSHRLNETMQYISFLVAEVTSEQEKRLYPEMRGCIRGNEIRGVPYSSEQPAPRLRVGDDFMTIDS